MRECSLFPRRMSLHRVRHNLSPVAEAALIAVALAYGVFAVYLASVRPLVVAVTADIRSVPEPIDLDTDRWQRATNVEGRYVFGFPNGWIAESRGEDIVIASGRRAVETGAGDRITIETRPIGDRNQIENVAVEELAGSRPALYDVAVHGRPGLFAVEFDGHRIADQTVYVQVGDRVHIFRAGGMDPAAFSAFISTVKFLPEVEQ